MLDSGELELLDELLELDEDDDELVTALVTVFVRLLVTLPTVVVGTTSETLGDVSV